MIKPIAWLGNTKQGSINPNLMKIVVSIVLAATFVLCSGHTFVDSTLFGRWRSIEDPNAGFMEFDSEGYVTIEDNGQVIGGKEFEIEGNKASMSYTTNTSVTPHQIDIVLKLKLEGQEMEAAKMLGVYTYDKNSQTLSMCINFEGSSRPTKIEDSDAFDLMVFKKEN
jgi:hypothetical protein